MKNNQSGGVLVSVFLLLVSLGITINMTLDFFRFNSSIQVVNAQSQDRQFLLGDLRKQARITSSIRQSMNDPNNILFKNCLLAKCTHSIPQGFFLASPMTGNLYIAGPKGSGAPYSNFGERCPKAEPGCQNLAYSFYNIEGNPKVLRVWIVAAPFTSDKVPTLPEKPSAELPVDEILKVY